MTAPNHALTGAVIGLAVANPWVALPLAFLSHFVCDAVPHYDPPKQSETKLYASWSFIRDYLVVGAALCLLLVLVLAYTRPAHWLQAAVCAFLATSPDLFWFPRFLRAYRGKRPQPFGNWFLVFHDRVQWKTGPKLLWVEYAWFIGFSAILATRL